MNLRNYVCSANSKARDNSIHPSIEWNYIKNEQNIDGKDKEYA
jgi:hypothetical protein